MHLQDLAARRCGGAAAAADNDNDWEEALGVGGLGHSSTPNALFNATSPQRNKPPTGAGVVCEEEDWEDV